MQSLLAAIVGVIAVAALVWQLAGSGRATAASSARIESGPCWVESFKVLAGRADVTKLHEGLKSLTERLAPLVINAHLTQPAIGGELSLKLHVESDGKIRMVLTDPPKLQPDTNPSLMQQLVGELMRKRELFPPIGEDCFIEVHLGVRPTRAAK